MRGFVDLHCHVLPQLDDGAPTVRDGVALLEQLHELGFDLVVATVHMRPGWYDPSRTEMLRVYQRFCAGLSDRPAVPRLELSCEHYLDDTVFRRLLHNQGLPLPGGRSVLIELWGIDFSLVLQQRLAALRQHGLLPVIAHPERYSCLWRSPDALDRTVSAGAAALLNVASLVGRYGRGAQRCAERLLRLGLYHAACSDAHHPEDLTAVAAGMQRVANDFGRDELDSLFLTGPLQLLAGEVPE